MASFTRRGALLGAAAGLSALALPRLAAAQGATTALPDRAPRC